MKNTFPKVLILYKDKYVTGSDIKEIYFIATIEYLDLLTESPISYFIFIQQTNITEDKSIIFSSNKRTITFYTVHSIIKNNLDSSSRTEAKLSFKAYPVINLITVKYTNLSDFMSVFGSYYAVFTLFAQSITAIFGGIVYETDLLNAVFKFSVGGKKFEKHRNGDKEMILESRDKKIRNSIQFDENKKNKIQEEIFKSNNNKLIPESFELKINEEQKPTTINNLKSGIKSIEEVELQTKILNNNEKKIDEANKSDNSIRGSNQTLLRKLNSHSEVPMESEHYFDRGKKVEIGIVRLFCLLYFGCCGKNMTNRARLIKKCFKIIEKYTQLEKIIRCQFELVFLKKMFLSEKQRIKLEKRVKNIQLDDSDYSYKLLSELKNKKNKKNKNLSKRNV